MTNNENGQKNNKSKILGGNTIVQFTLWQFTAIIVTILGIFLGFYKLTVQPSIQQTAEHQKELYEEQKDYINTEFQDIKTDINYNTSMIRELTEKITNLNNSVDRIENSGGSFGATSVDNNIKENNSENTRDLADKGN